MAKKKVAPGLKVNYASYQKARQAVRRLKIKTRDEYVSRYKKDKKLPLHPYRKYAKKGWTDWYNFLGKKRPNFYKTYQQAAQASRRLRFGAKAEYMRSHRRDIRLPSHPDEHYRKRGWRGWYAFLGKKKR